MLTKFSGNMVDQNLNEIKKRQQRLGKHPKAVINSIRTPTRHAMHKEPNLQVHTRRPPFEWLPNKFTESYEARIASFAIRLHMHRLTTWRDTNRDDT